MPRLRWTVRRMLVLVAASAIALEGWIVWMRCASNREKALVISRVAAQLRRTMAERPPGVLEKGMWLDFEDGTPSVPANAENCRRFLLKLDRMVKQHEYAARHPWFPSNTNAAPPP